MVSVFISKNAWSWTCISERGRLKNCLVRKDMDVDEHEILINSTLTYKTKSRSSTFIAVLHFSHNMVFKQRITRTLKWVWNGQQPAVILFTSSIKCWLWISLSCWCYLMDSILFLRHWVINKKSKYHCSNLTNTVIIIPDITLQKLQIQTKTTAGLLSDK